MDDSISLASAEAEDGWQRRGHGDDAVVLTSGSVTEFKYLTMSDDSRLETVLDTMLKTVPGIVGLGVVSCAIDVGGDAVEILSAETGKNDIMQGDMECTI